MTSKKPIFHIRDAKLVAFDLDQTIINNSFDLETPRSDIKRLFVENGIPKNWVFRPLLAKIKKATVHLRKKGLAQVKCIELEEKAFDILNKFETNGAKNSQLFENAIPTLKFLRSKNFKIALVTRDGRGAVREVFNKYKLSRFFDYVVTREDVKNPKPHPESIEFLQKQTGIPYLKMIFVGDHVYDMEISKASGITGVAVLTGKTTRMKLRRAGADFIINEIGELRNFW